MMHFSGFLRTAALGLFLSGSLSAQADLTVTVAGIEAAGAGVVRIMLFDDPGTFGGDERKAAYRASVKDFGSTATFTFRGLPAGTYAVMAYQDLNEDGSLSKNFIGFPREPLVALNMRRMSRPSFKKSSLELSATSRTVQLKLLNQ